ncbi:MAG: hypothetical protein K6G56_05295 [Clostridiales bacterium]|nr:hypothetical protein [Clostridiales bacterium]
MKKRIFAIFMLALMLLSLPVTARVKAAEAFPASEMPGYQVTCSTMTNVAGYGGEYDPSKPALEFRLKYTYEQDRKIVYTQYATMSYANPTGLFDWFGPDAVRDSAMGIEEKHSFLEFYQYEEYGWRFMNSFGATFTASLKEAGCCMVPEGQTPDEAIAAEANKKLEDYSGNYLRSKLLSFGEYPNLENQAEDPLKLIERDDGCLVVAHGSYSREENGETTFTYHGELQPNTNMDRDYRDVKEVTAFYTVPDLVGVFFYVTYYQSARVSADIGRCEEEECGNLYNEQLPRYQQFLELDLAETFAKDRSFITVTWEDPVDDRPTAEVTETVPATTQPTETPAPVDSGVTQEAEETPGEDGGVSVPAAIVIGVLGGGAAIAGAAAAVSGGSGPDDGTGRKRKAYKMYVQKDFGGSIRRGADPVKIRARMAEVDPGGAERDRSDLTAKIEAAGDGMTVHGASLVGRYLEATVSVPQENENDSAKIVFKFAGEGGAFTNTVVFRVVDGPSLRFIEDTDDPGQVLLNQNSCRIDAIPGDGFTYTEQFMIIDAPKAPGLGDITAVNAGGLDVKFELTDRKDVYRLIVKNDTEPDEEQDVFAKVRSSEFEIHVKVDGEKEPLKGYVTMNLYPEGITIASDKEGKKNDVKYVRVQAYEKEYVGDLDKKWQVSSIQFTLAVKGRDRAIVDPPEAKYKFGKLKGSGGLGMRADKEQTLAEKYEYKEEWGEWNGKFVYDFEPNANLSEPEDGTFLMVVLPASAEYDGRTYNAEIPLRLRGKDIDPMGEWEKEYRELERRIERFSLPENKDKWLGQLKECATEPRVSVEELRLVSKWILREYMAYWTTQQSRDQAEATMYNVIVNTLEWTKFAGDCAFSFLVSAYAGPVAEALISPAKDFITGAIGEVIAARNYGEEIDVDKFEFSKNLAAAGDNLVSSAIDLTNWRKAAATLGGYFVYCAIKNYLLKLREKNESDIWGALCESFKDMTAAALKSKAGDLIGKWLKDSKRFQEKIAPKIASYFQETKFDTLQKKLNDALGLEGELRKLAGYANDKVFEAKVADVVEKYIGDLVGQGFDKVREAYDSSKFTIEGGDVCYCFTLHLFDAFHFGIKLDLTRILQAMRGDLFGWFYDYFFAGMPAAESVIDVPKDPKLPPVKG